VNGALEGVAELVRRETGIVLAPTQEASLRAALGRAAPGLDPGTFMRTAGDPLEGPALVARLIDEITIKETTFLRDRRQLETISWHQLLAAVNAAGSDTIRVWSAGCATGEEPYTLALLALEAFNTDQIPVDVLGTDISGAALASAVEGMYRERAVGALNEGQRRRYLEPVPGGGYVVGDELRRYVRFARHNLARDPLPPPGETPFDLIVCRNVLIYFNAPLIEQIIAGFERSIHPDGVVLIGAADALCGTTSRLGALSGGSVPKRPATIAPPFRRPLGRLPSLSREDRLSEALKAASEARRDDALAHATALLDEDPLDADAYFVRGLVELESGEPEPAAASLRRALYVDPSFAVAAFVLGRAHDGLGETTAARRAYEQALRTLAPDDDRHEVLLQQVDLGDIAAACRTRLAVLA
jgi:chemotaxis protein methyltransferase CheR